MRLSEKEFQGLLTKCPQLAIHLPNGLSEHPLKYRNIKVYVYSDGYITYGEKDLAHGKPVDVFDSTKEYNRWNELLLLERAGKVSQLRKQVKLIIQPAIQTNGNFIREIAYKADFMYNDSQNHTIVEDVKPFDSKTKKHKTTKDFQIKWKLLQVKYPMFFFKIH